MSDLLTQCGEALFGSRWQSELARALAVSDRSMRRWAAGSHAMPDGARAELLRLTEERSALLKALAPRLRGAR